MTTQTQKAYKKKSQRCPECKSTLLVKREEERCIVCMDCGFVISNETSRLVKKENLSGNGDTQFESAVLFSKKSTLDENRNNSNMKIVSTLEYWKRVKTSDSGEKNLAIALQQTTQIAHDLSLTAAVLEKAVLIYKKVIEKRLTKGRSTRVMSATVLFLSCEQSHIGLTIKDIANFLRLKPKKILRNYRLVTKALGFSTQIARVEDRIMEISKRVQLSTLAFEIALKIAGAYERTNYSIGKDPSGIACGAIYLGAFLNGEWVKQRELAEASRANESTIRNRIRELEKILIFEFSL